MSERKLHVAEPDDPAIVDAVRVLRDALSERGVPADVVRLYENVAMRSDDTARACGWWLAAARHAWHEAFRLLSEADAVEPLPPPWLEELANAAWWTGQLDVAIDARERAFAQYVDDVVAVDGIQFPTRRRAYMRAPDLKPIRDLLMVAIDFNNFKLTA